MSEAATQEAILPASERTRTLVVTTREVTHNADKTEFKEVENQVTVFIRPLPFRKWPIAIQHIAQLFQYLPEGGLNVENEMELLVWVTHMLGNAGGDLMKLIELATGLEPEFFDKIDEDGPRIAQAVIEVNKDFFVQRVMPMLRPHLPAAMEAAETLGQTQ